ncbi:MAG: Flp pilus assembly complex ATPase component TadA [Chitinispirillaceae bacterium]|nr:Flp pilus assembly complex ATPase component TadA [Chitinispirillaceae bacterium]
MATRIGSFLSKKISLDDALLDQEALNAKENGLLFGEHLRRVYGISETDLYIALAEQFALEFIADPQSAFNADLLRELPIELFKEGRALPLSISDDGVRILVDDPLDLDIVQQVELATRLTVQCALTTPSAMQQLHKKYYESDSLFRQSAGKITREYEKTMQTDDSLSLEEIRQRTESEPVVKMAELIFDEAIKLGASDIHIEPSEQRATVRFRIDGLLRQHTELTKWMFSPITSRIKILADLDIAEKRSPQDGRIRYTFENQPYDFRVSTLPTHFGEKTVIRILKHDLTLLDLGNIGLTPCNSGLLTELIEKPQGMIFVTGPTGSGKSSTLFACLNRISHKAINITTIENPIEYKLEGINQVQINEKAGVTFASALRSILRQDPDVILVGEIRDNETAQIAIQAAQTGHLVLSTLHTNDALSAITRLRDLGVPSFLIASSVLALVAQRLVRVLCPSCKYETDVSPLIKNRWKTIFGTEELSRAFEARGCDHCNNTGFRGRVGIFELIVVNDKLRDAIADNIPENNIRRMIREDGFQTLIYDGIEKVKQGATSPEELLRIVQIEDMQ